MSRIKGAVNYTAIVETEEIFNTIDQYFADRDKEALAKGIKPRAGARREQQKSELREFIIEIVAAQVTGGKMKLDVSDKKTRQSLNVSPQKAKRIRALLKDANILILREWSKSTKPGEYPIWLLNSDYIKFIEQKREKRVVKNRKYKPLYYRYYAEATKAAYQVLEDLDTEVDVQTYMVIVYQELDLAFKRDGIKKADLLA